MGRRGFVFENHAALSAVVAPCEPAQPALRPACRPDRWPDFGASGRGLCHHRRHAARVRSLCCHAAGDCGGSMGLVLALGVWPHHCHLDSGVCHHEPFGASGQRELCEPGTHADLFGWTVSIAVWPAAFGHTGQLCVAHRGGGLYSGRRSADCAEPGQEFLAWRLHGARRRWLFCRA